ncbi:MAG: hypothetical protein CMJ46_16385 [Planctomyces sp.]|nr:hypothetical protein [Planctomyces sp.]
MNRFYLVVGLMLLSFTGVGCCWCGPVCDPCTGLSYGGCFDPCCGIGGSGGIFDTCCTGGYSDPCCDPCGGMSYGAAPMMSGPDCCTSPGPTYYSQPGASMSYPSSPGPQLSVPTPIGVPSGPTSYHSSPSVSSGLKVTSHPEHAEPVYQQSSKSPWIRAGY